MGKVTILDRVAGEGVTGKVRVKVRNARKTKSSFIPGKESIVSY